MPGPLSATVRRATCRCTPKSTSTDASGRHVRADVREEVVDDLPQAVAIADDGGLLERGSSIGRSGSSVRAVSTASATTSSKLDRLALERPPLVEAREQQQILDEHAHPLGLAR